MTTDPRADRPPRRIRGSGDSPGAPRPAGRDRDLSLRGVGDVTVTLPGQDVEILPPTTRKASTRTARRSPATSRRGRTHASWSTGTGRDREAERDEIRAGPRPHSRDSPERAPLRPPRGIRVLRGRARGRVGDLEAGRQEAGPHGRRVGRGRRVTSAALEEIGQARRLARAAAENAALPWVR